MTCHIKSAIDCHEKVFASCPSTPKQTLLASFDVIVSRQQIAVEMKWIFRQFKEIIRYDDIMQAVSYRVARFFLV
jgi:hypothetical protein